MALSKIAIDGLGPGPKRYQVNIQPGLFVRVETTGRKVLFCEFTAAGKRIKKDLGTWPELSIEGARTRMDDLRQETVRRTQMVLTGEGVTFGEMAEEYLKFRLPKLSTSSQYNKKHYINDFLIPALGTLTLKEVTPPVALPVLRRIESKGMSATPRFCAAELNQILNYAVVCGLLAANPCMQIASALNPLSHRHHPSVPISEFAPFFEFLARGASESMKHYALWSLCSLLRPGENNKMRWEWIDGDVLTIPAELMKARRSHRVPLTSFMSEILDAQKMILDKFLPGSPFVWASGTTLTGRVYQADLLKLIEHSPLAGRLVPHGMRATGRTWMAENGVPFEVCEAALAHKPRSYVVDAYNRSDYLEQRRVVMERWTEEIRKMWENALKNTK